MTNEILDNIKTMLTENGLKVNYVLNVISADGIMKTNDILYNPAEARNTLNRYAKYGAKFYTMKSKQYGGNEYFVKYSIEGFEIFKELTLFSSCMHNGGFQEVNIIESETMALVVISPINGGRAENSKKNREIFAKRKICITDL